MLRRHCMRNDATKHLRNTHLALIVYFDHFQVVAASSFRGLLLDGAQEEAVQQIKSKNPSRSH